MKHLLLLILLLCPVVVVAQGGGQQGGYPSYRFRRLAADPATCTTGDVYFNYVTPAYRKCQTANTWSDFSFSGGAFTSPLLGPDGTAALPTYSFSSDPNTGMFRSGADAIGFSTGGTERWVINSSGALNPFIDNTYDIGNGSVNPRDINISRKLIVGKAGTNTGQIDLAGTTSGTVSIKPNAVAGTWTLELPAIDGDSGQALTTSGSGVTSWTTIASGTTINATDGVIPYRSNSTTFADSPLTRTSATVLTSTADLLFSADNSKDIGASGANRPRTGYFGTSVVTGDGTATTPSLAFTSQPGFGLSRAAADAIGINSDALNTFPVLFYGSFGGGMVLGSSGFIQWSNTVSDATATSDTGIFRNAAGVVEVNNGTAGTLRDITTRNLIASTSLQFGGVVSYSAGTPSIAGNATLNTGSKDSAGKITSTGTGASTAVITFSITFTRAPACFVTNETTSNLVRPSSSTTQLTINATVVTGDTLSYLCLGY